MEVEVSLMCQIIPPGNPEIVMVPTQKSENFQDIAYKLLQLIKITTMKSWLSNRNGWNWLSSVKLIKNFWTNSVNQEGSFR